MENQLKKQVSVGSCKTFGRLASLFSVLRALPEQPPAMRAVLPSGTLLHCHDEDTAGEGMESRPASSPAPGQPMAELCCFEKINNRCHFIAGLLYSGMNSSGKGWPLLSAFALGKQTSPSRHDLRSRRSGELKAELHAAVQPRESAQRELQEYWAPRKAHLAGGPSAEPTRPPRRSCWEESEVGEDGTGKTGGFVDGTWWEGNWKKTDLENSGRNGQRAWHAAVRAVGLLSCTLRFG